MRQTLLYRSSTSLGPVWKAEVTRLVPDLDFRVHPEVGRPEDVDAVLVWNAPPGLLSSLPNLKLIISLGAGIDHLLATSDLPRHVPIMRLVDPYMIAQMSEYVTMQVLRLHRRDLDYAEQRHARLWTELPQVPTAERRVGVLGLGQYGADAARKLRGLGFDVAGWSRTAKSLDGIRCFHGTDGLAALLRRTDILVCLLPLTAETEGLLDRRAFDLMPKGAMVVNVGRGRHLVERDLLAALEAGQIGGAALDVFREEPLPDDHPFWRHHRVILTPHIAAATNPATCAPLVADALMRLREGRELRDIVDLVRGY
jgi:glyoxylate/hydroxypyruvate reductase A